MSKPFKVLSEKKAKFILVLARRIVPEVANLDQKEQREIAGVVDEALAIRGSALQFQFKTFLDLIRFSSMLRHGKTLERCAPEVQDRLLKKFEDSRIPRIRAGMWGLKTLIFMGYYGRHERAEQIKYTPSLNGNEKLHG